MFLCQQKANGIFTPDFRLLQEVNSAADKSLWNLNSKVILTNERHFYDLIKRRHSVNKTCLWNSSNSYSVVLLYAFKGDGLKNNDSLPV